MLYDFQLEGAPDPVGKKQIDELGYCGADVVFDFVHGYQNKTDISYFLTITSHLLNYQLN